ncbi:MAG: HDOD domain-containing protein [Desulfobacteraceae bacterium]|nr:HDOD domain-containing protein [Desulfobacteraceae bacterium]
MERFRREHIPAGNFRVEKQQPVLLQAFLGTCVGVALYDRVAKVGGMIHILLPEPPSSLSPEYPEKYASTGLPALLKELFAMGADPVNLTATVAGGALVAPLSQLDVNLNIGGRSTEIAMDILNRHGIRVIKSETGGFFTCTLELDMETGQFAIRPASLQREDTDKEFNFSPPTSEDVARTINNLKPIPQAALKILRMVHEERHDIKAVTEELAKDQVLSARVLQTSNSAMFAGRIRIESIKDAVLLLGETLLVKLIITAAVNNYFNQAGARGYSLCKGGIFFHAVGCGAAAEKIATLTGRAAPKIAYTAGLLHDIGKVVLDQYITRACPLFFRGIHHDGTAALDLEKKILSLTHCDTGALLAKQWNFSPALTEVIRFHHTPEQAADHKDLVRIVYLADLLMSRFNTGLELEMIKTKNILTTLDNLGLTALDFPALIDSIPLSSFDIKDQTSTPTTKVH